MRILQIIGSADPQGGGPIEGVMRGSAVMAALGHVNEIVAMDLESDPWVAASPLPIHCVGRIAKRYSYSPRFTDWLRANVDSYDVAIIHGLWNYSSIGAWRVLSQRKTPYFVFPHGMLDPWFIQSDPLKGAVKQLYWRALEARVLRDAARVFFTSVEERRLARATYPGTWRDAVVAYGAVPPPPCGAGVMAAFKQRAPALGDRKYLLFLSRIHPKKGCDLLIQAFARIATEHEGLDLVMAGPDQVGWRKQLERQARHLGVASRIHWPGMLSGEAKWGAFYGAEAFVLPSHQENFGIVVAEAMACGKPVLITRNVNIWREVIAGDAGLVSNTDRAGIQAMLRAFLALPGDERARMGEAALRCFLKNFEIGRSARDILAKIEDAVAR